MTTPPRPKRYAPPDLRPPSCQSLPSATPADMPGLPSGTKLVTGEHRGGHRQGPNAFGAVAADDVPGQARQDRCEGDHAHKIRNVPDSRGRRAEAAVPGNPRADSTAAPARDGAAMTAATDETAGERGGDVEGLCGPAMNASARVGLPAIMARDRPGCPVIQQERWNRMLESWLGSSERLTVVVGQRLSGKSRLTA